ncbi:MAG: hypothetical protein HC781_15410 [Leptolyngbyaceae cyanobacterium CSU_1_4]|nr:hypothetical protein [Leptolyngbyaceae cyanobacterium CSU_1_4]
MVSIFVNERMPLDQLSLTSYVSTENIISDYEGLVISSKLPSSGTAIRFKTNDVLISNIRPYLKKVCVASKDGGASNDVIVVRAKSKVNHQYLSFILKNDSFIEYVMRGAKGVKMPRGDISLIKKYPLAYPSLPEQQKIADCLSSIDDRITAETQKLDTLKAHKKGLMQQLFPAEGETLPKLRFPEFSDAGEWEEKRFRDMTIKSFYGTSSPASDTGKYPVLRMGDMSNGKLSFSNLVYIDLIDSEFEKFRLEKGDILLNRTNSYDLVGKISIFESEIECLTASYIVTYRLDKTKINPTFCNNVLNTSLHQGKIRNLATKAVSQANINPTTFKDSVTFFIPEICEQKKLLIAFHPWTISSPPKPRKSRR